MHELQWVDELYKAFCQTLPGVLHAEAQSLAYTLGLAPTREVPWSAVFSHGITLAAPALIAEAMPHVRGPTVQDALLAHMLAILDAFGTDRLEDGQVRPTWQLETLLAHVRRARDEALQRVVPGPSDPSIDFAAADEATLGAITAERGLLGGRGAADFTRYHEISRAKQRLGLPASLALAIAAGWDQRRREALERMLESIWVALQYYDDVMDWEEDWWRAGAWAVVLARGLRGGEDVPLDGSDEPPAQRGAAAPASVAPASGSRPPAPAPVRRFVLGSGVLARMLGDARRSFRQARLRAAALGAGRVASWAAGRESQTAELALCEARSPGYASRARALSAWAKAVLA
jgi:hypothetical protein